MLNLYLDMCAAYFVVFFIDLYFTRWQQRRYKRKVPMNKWRREDYPDMVLIYDGKNKIIQAVFILFAWPLVVFAFCICVFNALIDGIKAFFESLKDSYNDIF